MPWRESLSPVRMERVALVALAPCCRGMLVEVARSRSVELDLPYTPGTGPGELDRAVDCAVVSGPTAGLVGWAPTRELPALAATLAARGAAVVPLARPRGVQPPTLLTGTGQERVSSMLVDTYGTVPYVDVDPSRMAGLAYVVMFGMMFGDVGQGAMLLLAALVFGAVLLAGAYVLGTVNRFREGGWGYALYARSGLAGSLLFVAVGLLGWGLTAGIVPLVVAAAVLAVVALALIFTGLLVEAGGGGTGTIQAVVELVDTVIRLGSNVISFARLAAFGLTHAALMMVVWNGTTALWAPGLSALAAILVFVLGNVVTFSLEALVAGIQALRLEYYELFSRVFQSEGRPFRPWAPDPSPASSHEASPDIYSGSSTEGRHP